MRDSTMQAPKQKDNDVLRPLFDRCCRFAMDSVREAEARGDVLAGVPVVVIDLRRLSLGLAMVGADGYAPEVALEAGDASLGEIVGRFLERGIASLAPDVARQATMLHATDAASFVLVVPLDGGEIRITCLLAATDDPRRQANLFTSILDVRPTGPVH